MDFREKILELAVEYERLEAERNELRRILDLRGIDAPIAPRGDRSPRAFSTKSGNSNFSTKSSQVVIDHPVSENDISSGVHPLASQRASGGGGVRSTTWGVASSAKKISLAYVAAESTLDNAVKEHSAPAEGELDEDGPFDPESVEMESKFKDLGCQPWEEGMAPSATEIKGYLGGISSNRVGGGNRSPCVLTPLGGRRLVWDIFSFLLLTYEAWSISFTLIFLQDLDTPGFLVNINYVMTVFWFLDIALNFNTGYIVGEVIVMDRCCIVRKYLRSWFIIDLMASIPWDTLLEGGGLSRLFRFGKATKVLRSLRYVKTIRALRFLSSLQKSVQAESYSESALRHGLLFKAIQIFAVICILSHFHGCFFALFHSELKDPPTVQRAFRNYYYGFCWAFGLFVTGSLSHDEYEESNPGIWSLQLIMATERLLLMAIAITLVFPKVLCRRVKEAEMALMKADALVFLKSRKVSFHTCVRVLFYLEETGQARMMQENFDSLMAKEFPLELKRTVGEELWTPSLLSLGLILQMSQYHHSFITELCEVVHQETHPENTVLCKDGDTAISAYCVLSGLLGVFGDSRNHNPPDITAGMWLGEKALVNPTLRRSGTAVAKKMTQLMVLPSYRFHETLASLGMVEQFESLCAEHIWKGLCGRCGSIGDHFPDHCPTIAEQKVENWHEFIHNVTHQLSNLANRRSVGDQAERDVKYPSESPLLQHFISYHALDKLEHHLAALGIVDLEGLHRFASDAYIPDELPAHVKLSLSSEERKALSFEQIKHFYDNAHELIRTKLFLTQGMKHFVFISHYKFNAGTEAALIRQELETRFHQDGGPASLYENPIFLDSDDLTDLQSIQDHVKRSHNLILLLTDGVLTRPWVLVELWTAVTENVRVLPLLVIKPGVKFEFPDARFVNKLTGGKLLDEAGLQVLDECNIDLGSLGSVINHVFHRIAIHYSPHASTLVRQAQLTSLARLCHLKDRSSKVEIDLPTQTETSLELAAKSAQNFLEETLSGDDSDASKINL